MTGDNNTDDEAAEVTRAWVEALSAQLDAIDLTLTRTVSPRARAPLEVRRQQLVEERSAALAAAGTTSAAPAKSTETPAPITGVLPRPSAPPNAPAPVAVPAPVLARPLPAASPPPAAVAPKQKPPSTPPAPSPVLSPLASTFPRTFGNYVLLAPLGQGGMADVYLAKIAGLAGIEKHCVVKTLRSQYTDDHEYKARFVDEARVVVQLTHKNICNVFDVGAVDGRYYLAMEHIAGVTLTTLLAAVTKDGGKMDPGLSLHIVVEVLEALDYAWRRVDPATDAPLHLVHRDISPANVMVSFEGEVKLIDFGLASSTLKLEETGPNVVLGKVGYMAPEQLLGNGVDGRTDLFSVAILLYELASGERYYEGKTTPQIMALAGGTFRPRKWNNLDAALRTILDRALATDRANRFSSSMEFRSALERYRVLAGLRGDAPAMREVVHFTVADKIAASRAELARLTKVKAPAPKPDSDEGNPATITQTIARRELVLPSVPAGAPARQTSPGLDLDALDDIEVDTRDALPADEDTDSRPSPFARAAAAPESSSPDTLETRGPHNPGTDSQKLVVVGENTNGLLLGPDTWVLGATSLRDLNSGTPEMRRIAAVLKSSRKPMRIAEVQYAADVPLDKLIVTLRRWLMLKLVERVSPGS